MIKRWQVINEATGDIVASDLELANSYFKRLKGLQFRKTFGDGKAILLVPEASIHTHWMRFPIDVAMVDKHGVVLKMASELKPWKLLSAPKSTYGVFEWKAGSAEVSEGQRLRVVSDPPQKVAKPPKHLGYLYLDAA